MAKRPPRKRALSATSPKTGITHFFDDSLATEKMIRAFQTARDAREANELLSGLPFLSWLKGQNISPTPSVNYTQPFFRLVYNGFPPTSIAGSLSEGGRFNIGGAQQHPLFPGVTKFGCLYVASSVPCCYSEAAQPCGTPAEYELTPTRAPSLWDLSAVISSLGFPQLDHLVKNSPTDALWGLQKSPMISQLLASHLRALGGDGLFFPSTKFPTELNFALFFRDDVQSASAFSVRKIN